MGRLIDADVLLEAMEEYIEYDTFDNYKEEPIINISFETLEEIVEEQPTVYDVEKVVAELEEHLLVVELEDEHIVPESDVEEYFELNVIAMNDAIEIVKRGGAK